MLLFLSCDSNGFSDEAVCNIATYSSRQNLNLNLTFKTEYIRVTSSWLVLIVPKLNLFIFSVQKIVLLLMGRWIRLCAREMGYSPQRVLTRNFGKTMFLRHLGKSVRLKAYPHTLKHVKRSWGLGFFCLGFFALKRSLWTPFLGPFPWVKSKYKLHWNSKNVTNIIKALTKTENIKWKTYLD